MVKVETAGACREAMSAAMSAEMSRCDNESSSPEGVRVTRSDLDTLRLHARMLSS